MNEDIIPVGDVARQLGKHRSVVFKILKRLKIATRKQRDLSKGNQVVSCITRTDFERLASELVATSESNTATCSDSQSDGMSYDVGVFYLIQLEPEHDPGRFKVGFAASLPERLRALRCSAPFATVIRTWPCRRSWEQTAIDSVAAECLRIHTEVFRTDSLEQIVARCDRFFDVMPSPGRSIRE